MAKGPLRLAIEDMFFSNFRPEGGPGWWDRVKARWREYYDRFKAVNNTNPFLAYPAQTLLGMLGLGYAVTGEKSLLQPLELLENTVAFDDVSDGVAEAIGTVFGNPLTNEIVETIGAFITDPVVDIFEFYAEHPEKDPREFARAFHGFMISLNVSGGIADTVLETVSGGQVEGVGRFLEQMYWSLGLGFLGWQTLAPLLESGLQPGLRRYYQKLYRPERFSAADLRDLYAIGKITLADFQEAAREIGWRDQDVDQWIELSYRLLNESDIWQAYHLGELSTAETTTRLRLLGFNPNDIELLFTLNPPKDVQETRDFSAATAKQAYREFLIDAAELRSILQELNYSEAEISVVIALEDLKRDTDKRTLSQANIKAAWAENIILDAEALNWLKKAGFGDVEAQLVLDTWTSEAVPEYRKTNVGTIIGAYVEAVLTRTQAKDKLIEVGLSPDDADLELTLAEKRNPESFGAPEIPDLRYLSPGMLASLVESGLISAQEMVTRLVEVGYRLEDAQLMADAVLAKMAPAIRPLNQPTIERAYIAGVIDRNTAKNFLVDLGISPAQADIILETVEIENAEIFDQTPIERNRVLTASMIEDLVIAGLMTSAEMKSRLLALDFTQADADLLTRRAEQLAAPFIRPLTAMQIERAYLVGVLSRGDAKEKLIELAYEPDDAEDVLLTVERENPVVFDPSQYASTRKPSITVLAAAVQNLLISPEDYFTRALELGYTANDANLYLAMATRQERKSTRQLSPTNYLQAYDAGIMSFGATRNYLTQAGYSDADATLLIRTRKDLIENTDIWYSLTTGDLTLNEGINQLVSAGYTDEDIVNAFGTLPPDYFAEWGLTLQDIQIILGIIPGGE